MECAVLYTEKFISDSESLSKPDAMAVFKKTKKIRRNPRHFPFLHKSSRAQKARAGKLRIIFRLENNTLKFYRVGERDTVYAEIHGFF